MTDPIEQIVADALDTAGIEYRPDDPLDFECDGLTIKAKRFYTERAVRHLAGRENVILIQGLGAAQAFVRLLR